MSGDRESAEKFTAVHDSEKRQRAGDLSKQTGGAKQTESGYRILVRDLPPPGRRIRFKINSDDPRYVKESDILEDASFS